MLLAFLMAEGKVLESVIEKMMGCFHLIGGRRGGRIVGIDFWEHYGTNALDGS